MKKLFLLSLAALATTQLAQAQVISEIDLDNSKVEIVNNTASTVDLTGYFWCNRVNGSPFYPAVSAAEIDAANSTATSLVMASGEILVFQLTSAFLPASGGELGLYNTNSFGSRAALVDYVNYGTSTGVRDTVAVQSPAIWESNAAVDLSGAAPGETIQLLGGTAGDSVNDYIVAAGTIGAAQSAKLVISEIDLDNSKVEIVNVGIGLADLTGYFWCNRVNGSPFYPAVSASDIDGANSDGTDLIIGYQEVLVFDLTSAFLPASGGELGLYSTNTFSTRSALIDYVNYGTSTGVRDTVAVQSPAIWESNAAVDLTGAGPGDSIQLRFGEPGDSVSHYEVKTASIGIAQSIFEVPPPPGMVSITDFGFIDSTTVFIEFTYDGSQTVVPVESSVLGGFTAVSDRTTVLEPSGNRFEFSVPAGNRFFFRLEEISGP
ncbi:lamin tail domain-containing protein [Puniceicoccales bacterium CK1056]|uniref:Lamin tail domain-containing protein n=1 Tax=Oceanipulchritudo coccoides TaxID=2706888 RepID=A0A6B2M4C8_9BACT|nr:lamin tail domain-containing protein [Oceanipulchritudo coccoides]NDV63152.1 lamin tail domain-containing protein [Oceanipulchritudo coccoides]